jgi:ferrous iron transport protein A
MMPLFMARPNSKVKIVDLKGGKKFCQRLSAMGIHIGFIFEVPQSSRECGIILKRENCKLGIGFGMANKILVEEV